MTGVCEQWAQRGAVLPSKNEPSCAHRTWAAEGAAGASNAVADAQLRADADFAQGKVGGAAGGERIDALVAAHGVLWKRVPCGVCG